MTNTQSEKAARAAWSNQPDEGASVDLARARRAVATREAEVRRRDRIGYLCAAIIAPSWAAVMWFMPDLRVVAAVGFTVAVWVASQVYVRSSARLAPVAVDQQCVEYQQALLARERDFYLAMPLWYLTPVGLSQIALLAGFFSSPRFPRTAVLIWGAAALLGSSTGILFMARRRWRLQAAALQHELNVLEAASRGDNLLAKG